MAAGIGRASRTMSVRCVSGSLIGTSAGSASVSSMGERGRSARRIDMGVSFYCGIGPVDRHPPDNRVEVVVAHLLLSEPRALASAVAPFAEPNAERHAVGVPQGILDRDVGQVSS